MLHSMTGYGKSSLKFGDKTYTIEIKSLNSKSLDLNFKAVAELRSVELEIRKLVAEKLVRGKVDLFFQEEKNNGTATSFNLHMVEQYYLQLKQFSEEKNIPLGDIMPAILRFQDINKTEIAEFNEEDVKALYNAVAEALKNVMQFRKDEGAQLEKDIVERIRLIQQLKNQLHPFETHRIEKLRERLKQDIASYVSGESIDKNRFEEEIIYYLEKMDITEEKVRLEAHCNYFLEITSENAMEKGKKLGFIAQEIGREINTIGSKANDADMQKIVVQMKDELEKIKEQLMNVI